MTRPPLACADRGPLSPKPRCHCHLCREKGRLKRMLHRDRRVAQGLKPYPPHKLRLLSGRPISPRRTPTFSVWRCPCDPWQVRTGTTCPACHQRPPWVVAA